MNAIKILNKEYVNPKNLITPYILKIGKINKTMAFELSSGKFMNEMIYGVTIVELIEKENKTIRRDDLSECFKTMSEAKKYIKNLRDSYKKALEILKEEKMENESLDSILIRIDIIFCNIVNKIKRGFQNERSI